MKTKLSIVIAVKNEEDKIEACLKSVDWANEIIIVDGESDDRTVEICRKYTDKIFIRKNQENININKEFGFEQATNEWILYWDADEIVTDELKNEIVGVLGSTPLVNGFWIRRVNFYYGIMAPVYAQPDFQLRLFRKGKARYAKDHVHSFLKVNGEVGYLNQYFLHYSMKNIRIHVDKINFYTNSESRFAYNDKQIRITKNNALWYFMLKPVLYFFNEYIKNKAYKEGILGLILSIHTAYYYFLIMAKCWEIDVNKGR